MKAFLLSKDQDFAFQQTLPPQAAAATQDLELETLWNAMALGDKLIFEVARNVLLCSENESETIRYRQDILRDCLNHASVIREIYALAGEAIAREKKQFWGLSSKYPEIILHRSVDVLQMFVEMLQRLKRIADEQAATFQSTGFTTFFTMLRSELSEDYFAYIQKHLKLLKFRNGVLMSAHLGTGQKGTGYVLRKFPEKDPHWMQRMFAKKSPAYSFMIADRDESGARALTEIKNHGVHLVANALAQSTDHIRSFFVMVRSELAFYLGCVNVAEQLRQKGEPFAFPIPTAAHERTLAFRGLYDICLAFTTQQRVIGNDVQANQKDLVVITGANQGGKSTFLRSLGLAQLMMQCGMFVPAEAFCANLCTGVFTHYKREEDATMKSGKLDEELSRMSEIVDQLTSDALVLLNESFAATNEREGSEIARQIIGALLEKRIKVVFVTHLSTFAQECAAQNREDVLFLRAERQSDGTRTFKLIEGKPLSTSYGADLYSRIFTEDQQAPP